MLEIVVNEDKKLSISSKKGEVFINGSSEDYQIEKIDSKNFKIFKNNKIYTAEVIEQEGKNLTIKIDNQTLEVGVTDHIDQMLSKLGMDITASSAVKEIKAPMPGSILSIEVNEGDEVAKGDSLLILEAMKMENVIKSPGDGTIDKIQITTKENVEKNQVLITFA
ncbi:MAG: biotin/lipoyl-containing protein [Ekhidna sp.]